MPARRSESPRPTLTLPSRSKHEAIILATLGPPARMISGSKTAYRDRYPEHLTIFDANVCLGEAKIWHGDLDLTLDEPLVLALASETGQVVHVLRELDGRFTHEERPRTHEAAYSAATTGHTSFDPAHSERRADGRLYARPLPARPRWLRPNRPGPWRFWKVDTHASSQRPPRDHTPRASFASASAVHPGRGRCSCSDCTAGRAKRGARGSSGAGTRPAIEYGRRSWAVV